jgi:hypothetical protein
MNTVTCAENFLEHEMLLYLAEPPRDLGPARAPPLLIGRADSQWRRRGGGDVTSGGRNSFAGSDVTLGCRDVTVTATGSVLWLQSEAGNAVG